MAKKKKSITDYMSEMIFNEFYNSLSGEDKKLVNQLNISNIGDLLEFFSHVEALKASKMIDNDNSSKNRKNNVIKMNVPSSQQYHFRVKLMNTPYPVWREFMVPSNTNLDELANIINNIMGWDGTHLYHFIYKDKRYLPSEYIEEDNFFLFSRTEDLPSEEFLLADVFTEKGKRIKYEYDFGDSWMHEIWVKGIKEYEPNEEQKVKILKGSGACPPEDCGGVWGYTELLDLSKEKRISADERERLEWYGIDKDFDPEYFDIEYVKQLLE